MSLFSLISDFKDKIFGLNKQKTLAKITPLFDTEYIPDLEAGECKYYKKFKENQLGLEIYSNPLNLDLEKGDRSLIYSENCYYNKYHKYKIIENYVLFIDVINYLSSSIDKRDTYNISCNIDDFDLQTSLYTASNINDDNFIDVPLHIKIR